MLTLEPLKTELFKIIAININPKATSIANVFGVNLEIIVLADPIFCDVLGVLSIRRPLINVLAEGAAVSWRPSQARG